MENKAPKKITQRLSRPIISSEAALNILNGLIQDEAAPEQIAQFIDQSPPTIVNCYDHVGWTCALYALYREEPIPVLNVLFDHGAALNQQSRLEKSSLLHMVVTLNKVDVLEFLLKRKLNTELRNTCGATALYLAAKEGQLDAVKCLLKYHASPNILASDGCSPPYWAIYSHEISMLDTFLSHKVNLDARDSIPIAPKDRIIPHISVWGRTLLHWAIHFNSLPSVKRLLKAGANIEALDNNCMRPLHLAVNYAATTIINELLEQGANINSHGPKNITALHIAAESDRPALLEQILKAPNIDLQARDRSGRSAFHYATYKDISPTILHQLYQAGVDLTHRNIHHGKTILHILAQKANWRVICDVLRFPNINPYITDHRGMTMLHYAAQSNPFPDVIGHLCGTGLHPDDRDLEGMTPLFIAIKAGNVPAVEALLEQGASLNITDVNGLSALFYAAQSPSLEIVKMLLKEQCDVDTKTRQHHLVLYSAAEAGRLPTVNFILQTQDIDPSRRNPGGWNILHCAAKNPDALHIMRVFHHEGLSLDVQTEDGCHALHIAINHDNLKAVQYLLEQKIDPHIPDKRGRTPFQYAVLNNALPMMELLYYSHPYFSQYENFNYTSKPEEEGLSENVQVDLEKHLTHQDQEGNTALLLAASHGHASTITWLLSKEPWLRSREMTADVINRDGDRAIYFVARHNTPHILSLLTKPNVGEFILLKEALAHNNTPTFLWLLSRLHAIHLTSVIYDVAKKMCPHVMRALLEKRVDIESLDAEGNTILHIAATHGNRGMVEWLTASFPKLILIKNRAKRTPLEEVIYTQNENQTIRTLTRLGGRMHLTPPMQDMIWIASLLWVATKGGYRMVQSTEKNKIRFDFVTPDRPNIHFRHDMLPIQIKSIKTLCMNYILKATIRDQVSAQNIGYPPKPLAFYHSEDLNIEAAVRIPITQRKALLLSIKLPLPFEIRLIIFNMLWEEIWKTPRVRTKMAQYPPITYNDINPLYRYTSLDAMDQISRTLRYF